MLKPRLKWEYPAAREEEGASGMGVGAHEFGPSGFTFPGFIRGRRGGRGSGHGVDPA